MTKDRLCGLISIAIGTVYLVATLTLPEMKISDAVGPDVFPAVISIAAVIVGVMLLFAKPKKPEDKIEIRNINIDRTLMKKMSVSVLAGIIYALLFDKVGYIITTFLFIVVLMFVTNGKKILQNLLVGAVFAVSTYWIFSIWLGLSLPRGMFSL